MAVGKFKKLLQELGEACSSGEDLNEQEVLSLFVNQGFFSELGYGKPGEDIRLERRVRGGRADVLLRGITGLPICVIEFKRPHTTLVDHMPQLEEYVKELLPEYAILTDGIEFRLYRRRGNVLEPELDPFVLAKVDEVQASKIQEILKKRTIDWQHIVAVQEALRKCRENPVKLTGPEQEGGKIFLAQFALSPHVAFGKLTKQLFKSLGLLFNHSNFTQGAYAFWRKVYARSVDKNEIDRLARDWEPFLTPDATEQTIYYFMFSLETAYTILSRLLLAKAMEDAGFPVKAVRAFEQALDTRARRGNLNLKDYVFGVSAVFEEGKKQAFGTLFSSDIFDWWLDLPELDEEAYPACEALAEVTLAIFQFDFSNLSGDLLGRLYQSYFDPDMRRALGEFYTPPEVVDFILDQVGYTGSKIVTQRLLDPACGSGTFLIHALKRYLAASSHKDPRETLRGLIDGFRIVGFDINPFAVLMAQVNYALHILPTYAEALKHDPDFEIHTLPVFRTDSLRQEKREGEQEEIEPHPSGVRGFTFEAKEDIAVIKTELPVEVERDRFLDLKIPVPRYDRARYYGWVTNVEEYFKVQHALFAALRARQEREGALPSLEELQKIFTRLGLSHATELASYVYPAAKKIMEELGRLKKEYKDGRFLKTFEDLSLAMILKHELQYDYVVGNPPYVRIQNIPELSRKYWQGVYEWAEGNFDIFIPFVERALRYWLKKDGKLGFICSDRFLSANFAQKLREQLPKLAEIELLLDLRDTQVFKDALNYPAILIVKRTDSPRHNYYFVGARVFSDPDTGAKALVEEVQDLFQVVSVREPHVIGKHFDTFLMQTKRLSPHGWYLMPPKEWRVFRKLEKTATHRLQDVTLTKSGGFQGLATGCDDVFVLKLLKDLGDILLLRPKGKHDEYVEIEKGLLRPWLFGRDVERWHIAWNNWYVLFPYIKVEEKINGEVKHVYKLIPCKENEDIEHFRRYADKVPRMEDFPKAWGYLVKHKEKLRSRENERFVHNWYGAARPQNLELYEINKLIIQINSRFPSVAHDDKIGFVFQAGGRGGGIYGVITDPSKIDPWFALALMNSSVLDFFLKHISMVFAGRTYSYSDAFIKNLPIRMPKTTSERKISDEVIELAQRLTEIKSALRAKEREREEFPKPQIAELEERPELYPISRLVKGKPRAAQICPKDVSLQQQLDGSWAMAFGRSVLVFPTENHAKLVYTWLNLQNRTQVETAHLVNLTIPRDETNCARLLASLERIERELRQLENLIEETESEVDQLVAKLYGLAERDLRIIQEFLAHF
ncbi:MAG: N-6 DNA methylase [Candidatus Methanomethyliaceae archaeon]